MERFDGLFFEQLLAQSFAADLSCLSKEEPSSSSLPLREGMAMLLQQDEHLHRSLMAADTVPDVLQLCTETALGFACIAWGAGYVVDEKSTALDLVAEASVPDAILPTIRHYPPGANMSLHVKAARPLYLVRTGDETTPIVTSMFILPVLHNGRAIACLTLASDGQTGIPPRTRRLLEGLSDYAGIVLSRILAEDRVRRMQEGQQEMLSSLIHSLKTPLAIMHGYIDLLLSYGEGEGHSLRQDRVLHKVMTQSERVSALITDLLDLEEISSDVQRAECMTFSLGAIVEQVAERLDNEADQGIVLELPAEETLVAAEQAWVARAIEHVIINAIRFSSAPVLVQIRTTDDDVIVDVIDHGVGISPEALPHIFDRFYHAPYLATGRPNPSAGLGLSLAGHIINRFHGLISVTSTVGQGSRFSIELPRAFNSQSM